MTDTGLALRGIDHIRFFVGNARQSAYFYRNAFGFDVVAYEGLETGVKHEAGYVLRQGKATFVLTSSLRANDPDNMRLIFHGDGVKDVALEVDDVFAAYDHAVRHGSHPEFTPEPDMIHDCLGHVPHLMNQNYAELLTLIGKAVATTGRGEQVLALKRFSWFSIEFGLVEEAGETKVFGAGILSSTGEIPNSLLSPDVTRRPFVTDVVTETDYDPSRMQDQLFIAPSLPFLRRELEGLVHRFGIPVL